MVHEKNGLMHEKDKTESVCVFFSFFLLCGEILPSALRPQVGPMCNPTDTFCVFDCRNSAQGNEHEVYPTIQMRHAALERNKRCLLTYLYVWYSQNNILTSPWVLWFWTTFKYSWNFTSVTGYSQACK